MQAVQDPFCSPLYTFQVWDPAWHAGVDDLGDQTPVQVQNIPAFRLARNVIRLLKFVYLNFVPSRRAAYSLVHFPASMSVGNHANGRPVSKLEAFTGANLVDSGGLQVSWVRLGSAAKFRGSKVRKGGDDRVDFDRITRKWVTVSDGVGRFRLASST